MKRFHVGEFEGENMDSIKMANVLMLLSRGAGGGGSCEEIDISTRSSPVRVFECKTCNRQFPSFQALGGHRASHKKPRLGAGDGHGQAHHDLAKPKVHECSICGLEFAIGQALGGHMRRHRAALTEGYVHGLVKKKSDGKTRPVLWLDLNMPPEEEAVNCRKKIFGFELVDYQSPAVVDCLR